MGASEWDYYVPYQEDLNAALQQLRREVFEAGEYYWVNGADWRPEEEREPRPRTLEALWEVELVQRPAPTRFSTSSSCSVRTTPRTTTPTL